MDQDLKVRLSRIVEALDRLAPVTPPGADLDAAEAYIYGRPQAIAWRPPMRT
jgi:hypothetical protein